MFELTLRGLTHAFLSQSACAVIPGSSCELIPVLTHVGSEQAVGAEGHTGAAPASVRVVQMLPGIRVHTQSEVFLIGEARLIQTTFFL